MEVLEEEQQVSIEETETAEAGANLDFGKEDEASKAQTVTFKIFVMMQNEFSC